MREKDLRKRVEGFGLILVEVFHLGALFVIGGSIVWSAVVFYLRMISDGHASLDNLLLLFIYLELGAMIGIYFKTHRLPVRFLVYVAITALTRHLVVDYKDASDWHVAVVSGSILMLALASTALEYAVNRLRKDDLDY
jgi:phosphate starvation-inducible membrane PsiE